MTPPDQITLRPGQAEQLAKIIESMQGSTLGAELTRTACMRLVLGAGMDAIDAAPVAPQSPAKGARQGEPGKAAHKAKMGLKSKLGLAAQSREGTARHSTSS